MPSTSERMRRFMGADLARARAGQDTKTGMGVNKLREFARKPIKRRPKHGLVNALLERK